MTAELREEPDLLSEVFSTLRLTGELYFRAELEGDFALEVPQDRRLIRFHLVCRGGCWVQTDSMPEAIFLPEGSLAVIPNGCAQVLASQSHPPGRPAPLAEVLRDHPLDHSSILRLGQGGIQTHLLCGFCSFDEEIVHPILAHLPAIAVLNRQELDQEPWIQAALTLMLLETALADRGMRGILTRLLEIAFIQMVRRMRLGEGKAGYMVALADSGLSRALLAMHADPQSPWTVDGLARVSGLSRTGFAKKFVENVGLTPMEYLTQWRLMKARQMLRTTELGLEEIAARCGYESLPSFSRRFKTAFGIRPGAYRKTR